MIQIVVSLLFLLLGIGNFSGVAVLPPDLDEKRGPMSLEKIKEMLSKRTWGDADSLIQSFNASAAKCVGNVFETEASSKVLQETLLEFEKIAGSKEKAPYELLKKLGIIKPEARMDTIPSGSDGWKLQKFYRIFYDQKLLKTSEKLYDSLEDCFFTYANGAQVIYVGGNRDVPEEKMIKYARDFMECLPPKQRESLGNEACKDFKQ